jgi:HSP20 family molecular chaperone IbpA
MPIRYHSGTRRYASSASQVTTTVVYGRQWSLSYQGRSWRPPTDVYETADAVIVKMEVAGMSDDEFDITFADSILLVEGARRDTAEKIGCHQLEIAYGEFSVEVQLPMPLLVDCIAATYENGFLLVSLPKDNRRF